MATKAGCTMLTKRAIHLFTLASLLATTSLSLVSRAAGAPEEDSKEVSDLLSQARAQAVQRSRTAAGACYCVAGAAKSQAGHCTATE
jgi:hypothetical protein